MFEIIHCFLSGMGVVFYAFLQALPLYSLLDELKEQIIAAVLGIPTFIVALIFLIPGIIKVLKKIF